MILFPNCKINIGLDILRRRLDGYHDIKTVMYPVMGLCDGLEIIDRPEADGIEFSTSGLSSECSAAENLVVRAYKLMRSEYGIGGVKIHLHKNIPLGAGLGGGSSDAAFTIKALNTLFGLGLTGDKMEVLGARLGSDVPFFMRSSPQLCSGRGEIMTPINVPLEGKYLAIVASGIHVSTAEAYRGATPHAPDVPLSERIALAPEKWRWGVPDLLEKSHETSSGRQLGSGQEPVAYKLYDTSESVARELVNRQGTVSNEFEKSIFAHHPAIGLLKTSLYSLGAIYASMTGSGSAVYGIFDKKPCCISTTYSNSFIFRL